MQMHLRIPLQSVRAWCIAPRRVGQHRVLPGGTAVVTQIVSEDGVFLLAEVAFWRGRGSPFAKIIEHVAFQSTTWDFHIWPICQRPALA